MKQNQLKSYTALMFGVTLMLSGCGALNNQADSNTTQATLQERSVSSRGTDKCRRTNHNSSNRIRI